MRINYLKVVFILLAGGYAIGCALHPGDYHFLDGVNVLFHEAGHPIFGLSGSEFLMVMGGTLMQLIMPLIIMVYFFLHGQRYEGAVVGVWFGQNFFGISTYIKDAVVMELPLVGNGDRIHDWNYMLDDLGWLGRAGRIGDAAYVIGIIAVLASVLLGLYFSREKEGEGLV